jgi:hypothetical protein
MDSARVAAHIGRGPQPQTAFSLALIPLGE